MKITANDIGAPPVEVRAVKKVAPCGRCGTTVDRDSMWAMNVLFASPDDAQQRARIRLCCDCVVDMKAMALEMEWDNSLMRVVEV